MGGAKVSSVPGVPLFLARMIRRVGSASTTPGSPTVPLIRLLLPLNAQVWESSGPFELELDTRGAPGLPLTKAELG